MVPLSWGCVLDHQLWSECVKCTAFLLHLSHLWMCVWPQVGNHRIFNEKHGGLFVNIETNEQRKAGGQIDFFKKGDLYFTVKRMNGGGEGGLGFLTNPIFSPKPPAPGQGHTWAGVSLNPCTGLLHILGCPGRNFRLMEKNECLEIGFYKLLLFLGRGW